MNRATATIGILLLAGTVCAQKKSDDPQFKGGNVPFFEKDAKGDKSTTRTIRGVVRDARDAPVSGAVVTLTNKESKESQSITSGNDGTFAFDDCKKRVDYELKAAYKREVTPARLVSSFNTVASPFVELKLGAAKPADAPESKKTK
jgi:Carboxypeptidase regulatory-like domain